MLADTVRKLLPPKRVRPKRLFVAQQEPRRPFLDVLGKVKQEGRLLAQVEDKHPAEPVQRGLDQVLPARPENGDTAPPRRLRLPKGREPDGRDHRSFVDLMQHRVSDIQSGVQPIVDPPVRERERLIRFVLYKPRLHQHRLDFSERVSVELMEEPRASFALHGPLSD